ncbi:type II toxin-antitoxin system HigB family toxin [Roseateles amylovorans]|uniref:type II toxin-antitoxin system HigB family toxin n=1 Tax=Roseateles amylovorans TaxID=2978473 RepID=UPI00338F4885
MFVDVRKTFNSADEVGDHVVFNVNSNRVITIIHYQARRIYVRHVLTHRDYEKWTKEQRRS